MSPPPTHHQREARAWKWAADGSHRTALAQQAPLDADRRALAANPNDWAAQENRDAHEANYRCAVAEVVEYGRRERMHRVRARRSSVVVTVPARTAPRRRGAGRPRASATRSSARSGDSPEDGPPHRQKTAAPRLAPKSRAVLVPELRTAGDIEAGR